MKHRNHKGEPTERTFSNEVHGDDFANLAYEFKKTNKHLLIDDEPEEVEDEDNNEDESEDTEDEE